MRHRTSDRTYPSGPICMVGTDARNSFTVSLSLSILTRSCQELGTINGTHITTRSCQELGTINAPYIMTRSCQD